MQSAKIRDDLPVLKLTYYKDLDTLQYILGDRRELEAIDKMRKELEKKQKEEREKEEKAKEKRTRER